MTTANAVAGAVAGTLVSIVLHPVDTLKVTIQADRAARQPLARVLARMLRERGVFGLYSGLSASLASSAPISAIYTASYEAVKSRLMPMFPEERAWVAHCMAGGCASVATSFVYTPSECVKQRMPGERGDDGVAGDARNRGGGGVFGLYKGWTAVLCRNIPQSAIKFFVFEQLMRTVHRRAGAGRHGFARSDFRGRGHRGVHSRDVHNPVRHNQDEIADEGGDGRGWRGGGGGVADDARHRRKGGRRGAISGGSPRGSSSTSRRAPCSSPRTKSLGWHY